MFTEARRYEIAWCVQTVGSSWVVLEWWRCVQEPQMEASPMPGDVVVSLWRRRATVAITSRQEQMMSKETCLECY